MVGGRSLRRGLGELSRMTGTFACADSGQEHRDHNQRNHHDGNGEAARAIVGPCKARLSSGLQVNTVRRLPVLKESKLKGTSNGRFILPRKKETYAENRRRQVFSISLQAVPIFNIFEADAVKGHGHGSVPHDQHKDLLSDRSACYNTLEEQKGENGACFVHNRVWEGQG